MRKIISFVKDDLYDEKGVLSMSSSKEWMDAFYELYEDGRKHHKAPQSYIDYFKVRLFLLNEIRKAEERGRGEYILKKKQVIY